jgi:aspartate racemase
MTIHRLGVIGGVGPLAAAHFYRRLIQLSGAARDEDHLPVVLVAERIPSRIAHLEGHGPSPAPALRRAARVLAAAGVDAIAIPSATTHAYREEVLAAGGLPVWDLLAETGAAIARERRRRPLFFATIATVHARLYERYLPEGTSLLHPTETGQRQVDDLIERVKAGDEPAPLRDRLGALVAAETGLLHADAAVLACTELSTIAPPAEAVPVPLIDVCDVLARAVLAGPPADAERGCAT